MNDRYDARTAGGQQSWQHTFGRMRCLLALMICGTLRPDQETAA